MIMVNNELLKCVDCVKCALHDYGGAFKCKTQVFSENVKELNVKDPAELLIRLLGINDENEV